MNALTRPVRKIEVLTRSRAYDRRVYYVTCVKLTWISYVVDANMRDNMLSKREETRVLAHRVHSSHLHLNLDSSYRHNVLLAGRELI